MKNTKRNTDYDLLLLGAGPANIFAALEFIESGYNFKIAILYKGKMAKHRTCPAIKEKGCLKCFSCAVVEGFGGAGLFSDGKLHIASDKYSEKIYDYLSRFGFSKIDNPDLDKYNSILQIKKTFLKSFGLDFFPYVSQHIGTDGIIEITKKIEKYLLDSGVDFIQDSNVVTINFENNMFKTKYINQISDEEKYLTSKFAFVGFGKNSFSNSKSILGNLMPEVLEEENPSIGVRFEFPTNALDAITEKIIRDPQIIYKTTSGDIVRSFCVCSQGNVVPYINNDNIILGGQSFSNHATNRSNFAIIFQDIGACNENIVAEYAKNHKQSCSNKPLLQKLGQFLSTGKVTNKDDFADTTLWCYENADLSKMMPLKMREAFIEFITLLGKIHPDFLNSQNILSSPVVEYSAPKLVLDDYCKTKTDGLFIVGDLTGHASGILSSAIIGLIAAHFVLDKIEMDNI